jgi:hypothetical protein
MANFNGTNGPDIITGTDGDDTILGLGGDDTLNGGAGNDFLTGGSGTDMLTGGTGVDTFRDTASQLNGDRILDFHIGDRIQITDLTLQNANFQIVGSLITYNGGSVQVDGLGAGRLVLRAIDTGGVELRLQQPAHNDFNGDGKSDILWRGDDGTLTTWLGGINGTFTGNWDNFANNMPTNWHVAGTGDFNGDGLVDVLWRADDGTVSDWLGQANGGFVGNWDNFHNNPGTSWHVAGIGDFNGDGHDDVLWRDDNGTVTDWLGQANGGFSGNWNNFANNMTANWHVAGTGDFNGDGLDDVLWRDDNGTITDWLGQANGGFVGNWNNFAVNVPTSWHVAGTGDFNGDGLIDILWRADDGTTTDWLAQANSSFAGNWDNFHNNPGTNWHVASIGDFNGDAIDDVLWSANDGGVTNWLGQANGGFVGNWDNFHNNPGTGWHVQDPFA